MQKGIENYEMKLKSFLVNKKKKMNLVSWYNKFDIPSRVFENKTSKSSFFCLCNFFKH